MLDFHSKEIKPKVLSWLQNESKDVSNLSLIYKIQEGSKLY